ncbi:MAG: hypothetical protein WCG94_04300 [Methanothrix sp.]
MSEEQFDNQYWTDWAISQGLLEPEEPPAKPNRKRPKESRIKAAQMIGRYEPPSHQFVGLLPCYTLVGILKEYFQDHQLPERCWPEPLHVSLFLPWSGYQTRINAIAEAIVKEIPPTLIPHFDDVVVHERRGHKVALAFDPTVLDEVSYLACKALRRSLVDEGYNDRSLKTYDRLIPVHRGDHPTNHVTVFDDRLDHFGPDFAKKVADQMESVLLPKVNAANIYLNGVMVDSTGGSAASGRAFYKLSP